ANLPARVIERNPKRPTSRWLGWLLFTTLATATGFGAWRWVSRARPIEVEAAIVSERPAGTQAAILNATGYVTARRRATVSSKITGKLVAVNVEEGNWVREGQILARLDDATLRARRGFAEAYESSKCGVAREPVAHVRVSPSRRKPPCYCGAR